MIVDRPSWLGSRTSLSGKLSLFVSASVVTVVVIAMAVFCYHSYRVRVDERHETLRSVAATVAKLVERPISLGDYAMVEAYLSGESLPSFIQSISLNSPAGEQLAGWTVTPAGKTGICAVTRTVTVAIGRSNTLAADDEGVHSLKIQAGLCDIRSGAAATVAGAFAIAVLLIPLVAFVSRAAIVRALRPLMDAVNDGSSRAGLAEDVVQRAPVEIRPLLARIGRMYEDYLRVEADAKVGELAAQVAHDIRSPLAALEVASGDAARLSEEQRVLIRSAVGRIRDIANSLLDRQRAPAAGAPPSCILLSGLIESIITEKRLQYRSRPRVEIEAQLDAPSYGIFASVQPVEFKRLLSNLVNNAVEAFGDGAGSVRVTLSARDGEALISVRDDGKGIPADVLAKLGRRGETHGKSGGSGLGLHHARSSAESWGGSLEIVSETKGTTVIVKLPQAQAPEWFVSELVFGDGKAVVILDDDASIHQVWDGRLGALSEHGIEVVHVSAPGDLRRWSEDNVGKARDACYLLDYELLGFEETGLSLAGELGIGERSILVTSRHEEPAIMEQCRTLGTRMIPKGLAGMVPIRVEKSSSERVRWDAVLIDDDELARATWRIAASRLGKRLRAFSTAAEFLGEAEAVDRATPVYIDAELGGGAKGDAESLKIHALGFGEIYLATGHEAEKFEGLAHLRGVVGKDPPWGRES